MLLGYLVFGMAVGMRPILYHEPQGGFAPLGPVSLVKMGVWPPTTPTPPSHKRPLWCAPRRHTYYLQISVGASVVIAAVGGLAAGGHVDWEPIEGR